MEQTQNRYVRLAEASKWACNNAAKATPRDVNTPGDYTNFMNAIKHSMNANLGKYYNPFKIHSIAKKYLSGDHVIIVYPSCNFGFMIPVMRISSGKIEIIVSVNFQEVEVLHFLEFPQFLEHLSDRLLKQVSFRATENLSYLKLKNWQL